MNARQINRTLWMLAAALAGMAVVILLAALFLPVRQQAELESKTAPAQNESRQIASLPALSDLQRVAEMPLRRPLGDSAPSTAPAVVVAVEPAGSDMPFTLVGTIGTSLAMLRAADGTIELRAVGEEVAGVKVEAIRPSQVQVQYNGKSVLLETPKEPPPG